VLTAAIAGFGLWDAGTKGMSTPGELREAVVAGAGIITAVALSIFAAMRVAGEYRFDTVTLRLLAFPRRALRSDVSSTREQRVVARGSRA
jgi:hypothetical protein